MAFCADGCSSGIYRPTHKLRRSFESERNGIAVSDRSRFDAVSSLRSFEGAAAASETHMVFRYRNPRSTCNSWGVWEKWIIREQPSLGICKPRSGNLRKDFCALNE